MNKQFAAPQSFTEGVRPFIALTLVTSSQVKAIGYDAPSKTLAVAFAHGIGSIYHYPNVEQATFDAFMQAESVGKYFGQHIKALPFEKYPADATAYLDPAVAQTSEPGGDAPAEGAPDAPAETGEPAVEEQPEAA